MARISAISTSTRTFSFQRGVEPEVALTNFWPPEDGFVWSTNRWCEIILPYVPALRGDATNVEVALDLDAFKSPPDLVTQTVFVYMNGLRVLSREISQRLILLIELPAASLKKTENVIIIDTPDVASPSDHGVQDTRRLGVQLFSIVIRAG
jgi:hypothetical protein